MHAFTRACTSASPTKGARSSVHRSQSTSTRTSSVNVCPEFHARADLPVGNRNGAVHCLDCSRFLRFRGQRCCPAVRKIKRPGYSAGRIRERLCPPCSFLGNRCSEEGTTRRSPTIWRTAFLVRIKRRGS